MAGAVSHVLEVPSARTWSRLRYLRRTAASGHLGGESKRHAHEPGPGLGFHDRRFLLNAVLEREAAERPEPAGDVSAATKSARCSKLVVALGMERLTAASSMVRLIRSICPLVHGWFGLVSRCSISFATQIMSKRI